MVTSTRPAPPSPPLSPSRADDVTESFADWARLNARALTIGAIVLAAALLIAAVWRYQVNTKNERAATALFTAQGLLASGDAAGAQRQLETIANAYDGTTAGTEAQLLLARLLFEQGKHAPGLDVLRRADDVPEDLRASVRALTGAGLEGTGKYGDAAKAYEEAAATARFPVSKARHRADAARTYQLAGNAEAARRIWAELAEQESSGLAEEARVRLGELSAARAGGS